MLVCLILIRDARYHEPKIPWGEKKKKRKKKKEYKVSVGIFSANFSRYKSSARYCRECTYIGLHVKYPLFLSGFNGTRTFWTDIRKFSNTELHENFFSVGGQLFHANGQTDRLTDMTKLILHFRNFCKRAKKWSRCHEHIFRSQGCEMQ